MIFTVPYSNSGSRLSDLMYADSNSSCENDKKSKQNPPESIPYYTMPNTILIIVELNDDATVARLQE